MKKILLLALTAFFAVSISAQSKMRIWMGNDVAFEQSVTQIDSVTFVLDKSESALSGGFSVSPTKKVNFSKGNLQYQASTDTWRFAENQWDVVGNESLGTVYENGTKCSNTLTSASYSGWIDLFGWGTGNAPTQTSTNSNDYDSFVDWGVNPISNGGNETNQWRTLTKDEAYYLFFVRTNAASLFGLGSVNDVNGLIILPDDWDTPQNVSFIASTTLGLEPQGEDEYSNSDQNNYSHNTYTIEQWEVLESYGAIFLPAAGFRSGEYNSFVNSWGSYYLKTNSVTTSEYAANLFFYNKEVAPSRYVPYSCIYRAQSVRLVQDVE